MEKKFEVDAQTFIGGWYMPEDACDQVLDFFNDKKLFHMPGITGAEKKEIVEVKKCTQMDIIPDAKELNLYNVHLKLILDTSNQIILVSLLMKQRAIKMFWMY